MPGSLIGTEVRRVEDPDLLVGETTFIDNLRIDGMLHVAFVRSPYANADILGVDVTDAIAAPGVVAVLTAADLELKPFHLFGRGLHEACARAPLATDRVVFVGDPVAIVAATSKSAAIDAAELVIVDYSSLPSAIGVEAALADDAPVQFAAIGSNVIAGTRDADDPNLFGDASVVVRGRFENQRIAVVPMEGNAIAAIPGDDGMGHDLTVYVSTQMPHAFQRMACTDLGLDPATVRVITPHVGGGFGGKAGATAEHEIIIAAARHLGQPVSWVEGRSENLVALPHARAQTQWVEMGFRSDGTITGLRVRIAADAGAHGGFGGGLAAGPTRLMAQGPYNVERLSYNVAVVATNTTPIGAFRGAGRPEATAYLERIIDIAADELDIDPVEIRRRNLLRADQFPFSTLTGMTYDVGDYAASLDEVVRLADYRALRAEQAARRASGAVKQLGIGVSTYVEITAGGTPSEFGAVEVHPDGSATIRVGTSGHGQGHPTSFAMLVHDRLGIPMDRIRLVQSDTAAVPRGSGTGGSRSLQIGGSAIHGATGIVLDRARKLAARRLEADAADIVVTDDGRVGVAGVPASALTWAELAELAMTNEGGGEPLAGEFDFTQAGATFPFGAHIAVVEVDTETGFVQFIRHIAVDDCGRVLNPLLVRGQQHGGIAQGAAQALWEQFVYDADGNPLTSTLAEYAMPSAAEFPSFETANTETPTPLNVLGAKGIGESGTIGAMPSVQNAVVDAVSHLGVRHIDMPCTPERVWQAIRAAAKGETVDGWREPPAAFATLPLRIPPKVVVVEPDV